VGDIMLGEMSSGEMSFGEKCHRGETCPREKCYTGRNVVGRNVAGRNVRGEKNLWGETSVNPLNVERAWHSAVTTQTATFVFGGDYSDKTYEYLPKDSTKWLMGKT
jgi:hypothetical protein